MDQVKAHACIVSWDLKTDRVPLVNEQDRTLRRIIFDCLFMMSIEARQAIIEKQIEACESINESRRKDE
jgi:hypothetical protein